MRRGGVTGLLAASLVLAMAACGSAQRSAAAHPPPELTVGTLYASIGAFATPSQAQLAGLRFWAAQANSAGGVYVRAAHARLRVRIVAMDDQSSISLAANDYLDLVERRRVNVLVSDYGPMLTSPAVPIAQEHGAYLFDPTATDPDFFTTSIFGNGNSDMVMAASPSDSVLPRELALTMRALAVTKIAIIYDTDPFAESQSDGLQRALLRRGITPVETVPVASASASSGADAASAASATTTDYSQAISGITALHPDAVVEFGYAPDDIDFLQQLARAHASFRMVFTDAAGAALPEFEASVPRCALAGTYTYLTPPYLSYSHVNAGLTTSQFQRQFRTAGGASAASGTSVAVAGYTTGLLVQRALARAGGLGAASMQTAVQALSGSLRTLDGLFLVDKQGVQLGEPWRVVRLAPAATGVQPETGGAAGQATAGCGAKR